MSYLNRDQLGRFISMRDEYYWGKQSKIFHYSLTCVMEEGGPCLIGTLEQAMGHKLTETGKPSSWEYERQPCKLCCGKGR